ncbi:L,D-transpeptidase [Serpentinicella alkaliphila]|uniref:L,D-transpeptidase-like protein n=1 Tax=Serpentinicella alkaliphila TaxID=1734049 RepID=A0A4R2TPW3_9FIRM|nr:L,D-transpeptidase [Serpentinicella alkaliphila]QUH24584.1 L,D-transpeptidase [Serpentinicella alkaliphila]TCQ04682.1 L,D-transpeptidase-like protein [Serpentinicella alkaliphila]
MYTYLYYSPDYWILNNIYRISVDINKRLLTLYLNNKIHKTYPVAVGKPSTPTPTGTYTIKNKALNPGGPFGSRWMGLSIPHYGIHGTNNPASIGQAASKGCIRMHNHNVIELYNIVPIGTVVRII